MKKCKEEYEVFLRNTETGEEEFVFGFYRDKDSCEHAKPKLEINSVKDVDDNTLDIILTLKAQCSRGDGECDDCSCDDDDEIDPFADFNDGLSLDKVEAMTKKIVDTYGPRSQVVKAMEELGELVQALAKMFKHVGVIAGKPNPLKNYHKQELREELDRARDAVIEEIADVTVMLNQLVYIFDCEDEVRDVFEGKLRRTFNKILEDEKEENEKSGN